MSETFSKAKNRFNITATYANAQSPTIRDQNHSGLGNAENIEKDNMVGTEFISADDLRIIEKQYSSHAIPSIDINSVGFNIDLQNHDNDTPTKKISNNIDPKTILNSDINDFANVIFLI